MPSGKLAEFCRKSSDKLCERQVRHYFLTIKNEHHYAPGSLRVAFNGIRFFYTHSCKRDWPTLRQIKIPNSKTLPEVLTIAQVHQIIDACKVQRARQANHPSNGQRKQKDANGKKHAADGER